MSDPGVSDIDDTIALSIIAVQRAMFVFLEVWTSHRPGLKDEAVGSARELKLRVDDLNLLLDDIGAERL
jgi:hypothetical protein